MPLDVLHRWCYHSEMRSRDPEYRAAYWKAYREGKLPYKEKPCAICGHPFRKASEDGGNPKTCTECRLGRCAQCGSAFKRKRLATKFCSMACKDSSQKGSEPPHLAANRGRKPRTYAKTRGKHGSAEDREWRQAVFERDDYTCQMCGKRGDRLQADHIKPYADHPDLRHVLANGRTLCVPCHRKTPTYGWGVYWQRRRVTN